MKSKKTEPQLPVTASYPNPDTRPWDQVPLGIGTNGEMVWNSLFNPHLTVIGRSGSSGSILLRDILIHCAQHPDQWEVKAVDVTKVTLSPYKNQYGIISELALLPSAGSELIQSLCMEMRGRYDRMVEAGVAHFRDLPEPPKAILLVINAADLFAESNEYLPKLSDYDFSGVKMASLALEIAGKGLSELHRLGGAAGIHVVTTTSFYAKELPPLHLAARVILGKGLNGSNSSRLLDYQEYDLLSSEEEVAGRAFFQTDAGNAELFQMYYADPRDWLHPAE